MNHHVIVREIDRAEAAVIDELGQIGTSTVHEAIGRFGFVGPHIRPIQHDVKIAGSAVTVLSHPGDNIMIHAAVEVCRPGDVLVVVNTAPSTHGMFGDLLAGSLMAHGVRGLAGHVAAAHLPRSRPGSADEPLVLSHPSGARGSPSSASIASASSRPSRSSARTARLGVAALQQQLRIAGPGGW